MSNAGEKSVQAAELTIFQRRALSLAAAEKARLPGRFKTVRQGGLRASMATGEHYGYLNLIEGLDELSVVALPAVLQQFPARHQPILVAASPSLRLVEQLLHDGYKPAPARPIAYRYSGAASGLPGHAASGWKIHEVSSRKDARLFLDLLDAGYNVPGEIGALIRAEHARPRVRGFMAFRNGHPLAAAPGSPSIRNLAGLGFTIVERTAWRRT